MRERARAKAILLGGLAGGAGLGFGLFFAGAAWLFASWFVFDDCRPTGTVRHAPAVAFVLGLLTSSLLAARFGLLVGRDWYRNGR